jgi:chemotaxis protein histidine kinase CheA
MPDDFDYSVFINQFVDESRDHLKRLNNGLLELEEDPGKEEVLADIVREAHTLKGAARMMGAEEIATVSHKLEDLLSVLKEKRLKLNTQVADVLFESFDSVDSLLKDFAGQNEPSVDISGLVKKLEDLANGGSGKAPQPEKKKPQKPAPKKEQPKATVSGEGPEDTIRVSSVKLDKLANLVSEMVVNRIKMSDREKEIKELIELSKQRAKFWRKFKDDMQKQGLAPDIESGLAMIESSRADLDKQLYMLFRRWREDVSSMEFTVSQLKQEVLEARMLPVSTLFATYHRPVRDLAKQFGKEVDLVIEGGDTELDKMVIEGIHDPLIHIIRNAVDHGIEMPGERKRLDKPHLAKLTLKAYQEGEHVIIEVSDDGAGIDIEKVRQKAVSSGLITKKEIEQMNDINILQLVFKPGFSTSEKLTEISGRGVGMDVVKDKVEELKGIVYLRTEKGKGTAVIMQVPLTMALSRVLFVKAAGQMFGVPTTSVEQILRIKAHDITTIEGKEAFILRGHGVPLIRLGGILGLKDTLLNFEDPTLSVVVINLAENRIGFVVDEVAGEHEVVIKTLGNYLKKVEKISGASILSSGDIVLILNVTDLVASIRGMKSPPVAETGPVQEEISLPILVVDDSLTAREVEKNILSSAGYKVDEAIDGVDALEKMGKKQYSLVVADIQMPRMDGFDLTRRIKKSEKYKDTPVVIVTTLEKEEDKKHGYEVGADAYIVKKAFDQAYLLKVIDQLIG